MKHAPSIAAALLALALAAPAMSTPRSARTPDFSAQLDARWDFAKPELSETRFRQALAQYPAGSREALEITTQIARAQGLQRKFDAANATLDAVEAAGRADRRVQIRYLLERGRVLNSSGAPAQAMPLFRKAAELASLEAADAFYQVDALHMLGIAAAPAEQLDWNLKALARAEASSDARTRGWRASLYHNIGWSYFERQDFASALDYWRKALAAREAANDVPRTRVAKWTVARGLRALGRLDEAEQMQRALAAEFEQAGEKDGFVFEELAEIEMARGRRAEAAPWAAKAFAILREDPWFVATEPARLKRLAELGSGGTP